MDFVHLHNHSAYSLLDGLGMPTNIIKYAKKMNQKAVALTDHGVMYAVIDFYKEAIKENIKPIIGCEFYVAPRSLFDKTYEYDYKRYHLVLLAKNNIGYHNLIKLVSISQIDGFYVKPRIDKQTLLKYSEGLICLSGCLAGEISQQILQDNIEGAKNAIKEYITIFGKDDFYLEIQNHNTKEDMKIISQMVTLSNLFGLKLVATNDVHYLTKEDARYQEILMCIQMGKTIDDPDRMKFNSDELYFKSTDEMNELFSALPSAIKNSVEIADKCNVTIEFGHYHLPKFPLPNDVDAFSYLKNLCYNGLKERYENLTVIKDRLDYELDIIKKMGFVDYFLIVWDYIKFAKDNKIAVGPGRGSAAGSLVSYCLNITTIDPIKYNLIFERFLNPERITMPDIDVDFCIERRHEVFEYVVKKYGKDNVAQIITFGTLSARSVIRDVGRTLNISYAKTDKVAKAIPFAVGQTIDNALKNSVELEQLYKNDSEVTKLIDVAKQLEGLPRHASTHAAGVVVAKTALYDYVPLQLSDDIVVTQFTMTTLEELGLLKMDFLGLRNLTVIRDTIENISKNRNINLDMEKIDYNDKAVYELIASGDTEGIFQLESAGMTNFMRELKPDCIEEVIAGISLFRPGPADSIPKYIENRNNPEKIEYKNNLLEGILKSTYGCIVYQEQVMQIVQRLAGYSLGRADLLRKAMGKKKPEIIKKEENTFIYGDDEIPGAIKCGMSETDAKQLFKEMADFGRYAFNKSHAAAYAKIAYQTAFLKKYYRVEFMCALMSSQMNDETKIASYIEKLPRFGIKILPVDINKSCEKFVVEDNQIRFALNSIKNLGKGLSIEIVKERENKPYSSLTDFCMRTYLKGMNKRALEFLIKAGAFDSFGKYRSQYFSSYEKILDIAVERTKEGYIGQLSLFGENEYTDELSNIDEFEESQLLTFEKEALGVYISGHPLNKYKDLMQKNRNAEICDIINNPSFNGKRVVISGIVTSVTRKNTKKGDEMAFLSVEDLSGLIELIVFPKQFVKYFKFLYKDSVIKVSGTVDVKEGELPKILVDSVLNLKDCEEKGKMYIKIPKGYENRVEILKEILLINHGKTPVCIYYEETKKAYIADGKYWANIDDDLEEKIYGLFEGKGEVIIK